MTYDPVAIARHREETDAARLAFVESEHGRNLIRLFINSPYLSGYNKECLIDRLLELPHMIKHCSDKIDRYKNPIHAAKAEKDWMAAGDLERDQAYYYRELGRCTSMQKGELLYDEYGNLTWLHNLPPDIENVR